jgi:hypothetical protein
MTTIQCQRAHGSRSSRAGILVVIVEVCVSVMAVSSARRRKLPRAGTPKPGWTALCFAAGQVLLVVCPLRALTCWA